MTAAPSVRERALVAEVDTLRRQVDRLQRHVFGSPVTIPVPSIARLVEAAAAEFDVEPAAITSPLRLGELVQARQVVMHLAVTRLRHSLPIIGRCLNRDHTTVLHGARCMAARIAADPDLAARVARVAAAIATATRETEREQTPG